MLSTFCSLDFRSWLGGVRTHYSVDYRGCVVRFCAAFTPKAARAGCWGASVSRTAFKNHVLPMRALVPLGRSRRKRPKCTRAALQAQRRPIHTAWDEV